MRIPVALPTLTAGAHDPDSGQACVMEYVSVLAGEPWSDRPECTHPILAHEARTANDLLDDPDRSRLVPLVGRLFGTGQDSPLLRARMRMTQARQVLRLVDPGARAAVMPHLERAEALAMRPEGLHDAADVERAGRTARDVSPRSGDLDQEHEAHHLGGSRIMAFVLTPDATAAEAWALTALVAAHRLAAGECRADCGDERARALRIVRDLRELLDVYDDVTGRVAEPLAPSTARTLATHL